MNSTLQRKIQKVLEIKLDQSSEELIGSLDELSIFYKLNSIAARRNLRNDIERRYLDINQQFLDQFTLLYNSVEELVDNYKEIEKSCNDVSSHFDQTNKSFSSILDSAKKMFDDLKETEEKEKILSNFIDKFKLKEEEELALQRKDIDMTFFNTLDRLSEIHRECKSILSKTYQRPTYEIMEMIAQHQEKAYRRLYSFIKEESRSLQSDQPEPSKILELSLSALQERPRLLLYCLEDIGEYRQKSISTTFITALTLGGPNGTPRPIEINAHDPFRFLGDMLAWIHQALASEHELLTSLLNKIKITVPAKLPLRNSTSYEDIDFSDQSSAVNNDNTDQQQQQQQDQVKPIQKVLDICFEGISRPLTVRIEQILQSKPGIIVIYKMITLLDFYSRIALTITHKTQGGITKILSEGKLICLSVFYAQIKDHFEKIMKSPTTPSIDLTPTAEIKESINKLKELITTFSTSLVPDNEREDEFKPVLTAMVDPIVNLCTVCATTSKLPLPSMAAFIINGLSVIQSVLSLHNFTKARLEVLIGQIDAHMDTLVEEQTSDLLSALGLSNKLSILQYHDSGSAADRVPLSQVPGMDRMSLTQALRQFDTSLESSLGSLAMPYCEKISNTKLKNLSKQSVTNLIISAYSSLYSSVLDPSNQYDDPNTMFQYNPNQIKKMLH